MAHGQHPGMAGMAPGMMHPGVSGPQGSQGPMGAGMPTGAPTPAPGGPMPNAHAMSHLGPQQQHMFQPGHPQMAQFNNNMIMQQQMMRQKQMAMAMQQHMHSQPGHVPVTMPNGAQGMNQAQLAAIRAGQMPGHPGMQFQQMPGQGGNPQMQNPQHQQMLAAQQAQAHYANQQALQHQQQQAAQARNNQMMQEQNATTQPPPPQPTPTPQAVPPPQPTPQPQPAQPTQAPQQPSQQPQQQQNQNQQQSQQPQQPQQSQPSQPARDGQPTAQEAQMHQQRQANLAMMMQQQQQQSLTNQPRGMKGAWILRLAQFTEKLNNKEESNTRDGDPKELRTWQEFVNNYFTVDGNLRQQLYNARDGGDKRFQLGAAALPRYYWKHFTSGVKQIQLHYESAREIDLPNGAHFVIAVATTTHIFHNGIRIIFYGDLKATFAPEGKIEFLDMGTRKHEEFLPRALVEASIASPEQKQSPEMNKKMKKSLAKIVPPTIPSAPVGDWGISADVLGLLEVSLICLICCVMANIWQIGEVFTTMERVMAYHKQHNHLAPGVAFEQLVSLETAPAQNAGLPGGVNPGMQQMPSGQRTPGLNGPNAFHSPAMAHLGLPQQGSPAVGAHTPSPHQGHMAGPVAMTHQQSQQGSNMSGSQGASANTSPNVAGKKRRASAVKLEGDDSGGAEVNGVGGAHKVKPSPRIGGKRQKGTA